MDRIPGAPEARSGGVAAALTGSSDAATPAAQTSAATPADSGRLVRLIAAGMTCQLLGFGARTGLLAALAAGPATMPELASKARGDPAMARDWLGGMVASGLVTTAGGIYQIPPGLAALLRPDAEPGQSLLPAVTLLTEFSDTTAMVADAFGAGGALPEDQYPAAVAAAMEQMSQAWIGSLLPNDWVGAIPGLAATLTAGAQVAEIGCGEGHALEVLARHYPATVFVGFDLAADLVTRGNDRLRGAGLAGRVRLVNCDARDGLRGPYALVLALSVLHDTADPGTLLEQARHTLRADGHVLVVESARPAAAGADPIAAILYATSVLYCVPTARSRGANPPQGTLGMTARTLADVARRAGLAQPTALTPTTPFVTAYDLARAAPAGPAATAQASGPTPSRPAADPRPGQVLAAGAVRPVPNHRIVGRAAHLGLRGAALAATGSLGYGWTRSRRGRAAAQVGLARRIVAGLPAMGPVSVKFAQLVSARPDLLPEAVRAELSTLQDDTPPMTSDDLDRAWRGALAANPNLAELDLGPCVGTGSVACVYRAEAPDGTTVAVKVQRPGIHSQMATDLALSAALTRIAQHTRAAGGAPLADLVAYMNRAIFSQVDFVREAHNTAVLRANLAGQAGILVPAVQTRYCSADVLTTNFIPGLVNDPPSVHGDLRAAAARTALTAVSLMVFRDGFVHCDLHPGNLYVRGDGSVVLLDVGYAVRIPPRIRDQLRAFFTALAVGDGVGCGEAVFNSALDPPSCRRAEFVDAVAALVAQAMDSGRFEMVDFGQAIFEIQNRFGIHPPADFAFPLVSMLVVEGTLRGWWPDLEMSSIGSTPSSPASRSETAVPARETAI